MTRPQQGCIARIEPLESRAYLTAAAIDTSFGNLGTVTHTVEVPVDDRGRAVVAQPDGKVVAVGTSYSGAPFAARFNADGSLDPTFGRGGRVSLPGGGDTFGDTVGEINAVALQRDGKILLAGQNFHEEPYCIRLNADGSLDRSFGKGGVAVAAKFTGQQSSMIRAVAVMPDGKIVLGGSFNHVDGSPANSNAGLARLLPTGEVDRAFGVGGVATLITGDEPGDVQRVRPLADGSVLVAGTIGDPFTAFANDFLLARFTPDGAPAASFGSGGWVRAGFGGNDERLNGLAVLEDGGIVISGHSGASDVLARYTPAGQPATQFGDGGVVRLAIGSSARDLLLTPEGKLVLVGEGFVGNQRNLTLARFTGRGKYDRTFASRGSSVVPIGQLPTGVQVAAAIDKAGRFLALSAVGDTNAEDVVLTRLTAAGALDRPFGNRGDGQAVIGFTGPASTYDASAARQADGKVVVASVMTSPGTADLSVTRFNRDGSIDPTFGDGGTVLMERNAYAFGNTDVVIDAQGRILVSYVREIPEDNARTFPAVLRLTPDGRPDMSFGDGGVATFGDRPAYNSAPLALQGSKILVAFSDGGDFTVARLDAAGRVDTTFAAGGYATVGVPTPPGRGAASFPLSQVTRVRVGADGSIVLVGYSGFLVDRIFVPALVSNLAVVKFTAGGRPDASFGGGDGVATLLAYDDLNGSASPSDARFLPGGRIAVAAHVADGDFELLVLRPDGTLDPTFAARGRLRIDFTTDPANPAADVPYTLLALPDGGFVVAGTSSSAWDDGITRPRFAVARVTADGRLDPAFGVGGRAVIAAPDGYTANAPRTLIDDGGGKVLVVGSAQSPVIRSDQVLTRLIAGGATPAVTASVTGGVLTVRGTAGADRITIRRVGGRVQVVGQPTTFDPATFSRVEVLGLAGDDRIDLSGLAAPATIDAGGGNDVVLAGAGNDSILGGTGNDTLFGGSGHDTLRGGDGNDYLNGGRDADRVFGDAGNDQIFAVDANVELIDGGAGFDRVKTDANDLLTGAEGLMA